MSDSPKPSSAFWATVISVSALIFYPLSFGPACWVYERIGNGTKAISIAYRPVIWFACECENARPAILWYAGIGTFDHRAPTIADGEIHWGLYADFSALIHLIETTVRPGSDWGIDEAVDHDGTEGDPRDSFHAK